MEREFESKRQGKTIDSLLLAEAMLRRGEHVHRVSANNGTYCAGGDGDCPLFGIQLREAIEAWTWMIDG